MGPAGEAASDGWACGRTRRCWVSYCSSSGARPACSPPAGCLAARVRGARGPPARLERGASPVLGRRGPCQARRRRPWRHGAPRGCDTAEPASGHGCCAPGTAGTRSERPRAMRGSARGAWSAAQRQGGHGSGWGGRPGRPSARPQGGNNGWPLRRHRARPARQPEGGGNVRARKTPSAWGRLPPCARSRGWRAGCAWHGPSRWSGTRARLVGAAARGHAHRGGLRPAAPTARAWRARPGPWPPAKHALAGQRGSPTPRETGGLGGAAVWCDRPAARVARLCNRLKSRGQMAPLCGPRDDHSAGLTSLLTLGVRV